jgi:hypothetical protein
VHTRERYNLGDCDAVSKTWVGHMRVIE